MSVKSVTPRPLIDWIKRHPGEVVEITLCSDADGRWDALAVVEGDDGEDVELWSPLTGPWGSARTAQAGLFEGILAGGGIFDKLTTSRTRNGLSITVRYAK